MMAGWKNTLRARRTLRRLRVASLALLAALFLSSTLGVASGSPQMKRMEGLFGTILELSQAPAPCPQ